MTIVEEVLLFARDYINKRECRTGDNKTKIRQALRVLTGEILNFGCSTCYIEALFKIIKITKMATSKYELKKGVVLQVFGDPTKTCTNNTITDELGDWYVKHHPEKLVYFARYPKPGAPVVHRDMTIVPPEKKETFKPTNRDNIVKPDHVLMPDPLKMSADLTEVPPPVLLDEQPKETEPLDAPKGKSPNKRKRPSKRRK